MKGRYDYERFNKSVSYFFVAAIIAAFMICIANHVLFPGEKAEIKQLRMDVAEMRDAISEDVIGQVTEWNRRIESKKQYNRLWWSCLFIPDGWDSIETIKIPIAEESK